MSRLFSIKTVISKECVRVYGYAWFKVDLVDFVRLYRALRFDETDVSLTVPLIERETQGITDSVPTYLVAPAVAVALS